MAKLKTIFRLSSIALFLVMCAVLFVLSLPRFGWKALTVQTGSMRPAIQPKTLVLVHRVPANQLKVGDVITYVNPANKKSTITHRIIAIAGRHITVRGDANPVADSPLTSAAVVGKVSYAIPHAGYISDLVQKPLGLAILLILGLYIPALVIIIGEICRLNDHYRKSKPYVAVQAMERIGQLDSAIRGKVFMAGKLTIILVVASVFIAVPARALLLSRATLTGNTIFAHRLQCTGNNNNSVVVNNDSTQSASSGDTLVSGNTSGGSATSGSAGNSNSTTVTVSINDCH